MLLDVPVYNSRTGDAQSSTSIGISLLSRGDSVHARVCLGVRRQIRSV